MNIKMKGSEVGELAIEESAVRSVIDVAVKNSGDGTAKVNQRFLVGNTIRVKESKDKQLIVDLEVNMPYDVFLPDAMREVQNSVKRALSKNLGIENAVVNVDVTRIARGGDAMGKVAAARATVTKAAEIQVAAADEAVTRATATGKAVTKAAAAKMSAATAAAAATLKSYSR